MKRSFTMSHRNLRLLGDGDCYSVAGCLFLLRGACVCVYVAKKVFSKGFSGIFQRTKGFRFVYFMVAFWEGMEG